MPTFDRNSYSAVITNTYDYIDYILFNRTKGINFGTMVNNLTGIYSSYTLSTNKDNAYYKFKMGMETNQKKLELAVPYFKRTLKIRNDIINKFYKGDMFEINNTELSRLFEKLLNIDWNTIEKTFSIEGKPLPKYTKKYHNLDDTISKIYLDTTIDPKHKLTVYRNGIISIKPLGKLDRLGIFNSINTHFSIGSTTPLISISDEYIVPNRIVKE